MGVRQVQAACGARSSGSRWPRRCSRSARRSARRRQHHRRPPPRRGRTSTATCPTRPRQRRVHRHVGGGEQGRPGRPRGRLRSPAAGGRDFTDTGDRYRIASISKVLTAIVVLKLVEQGRLGIDQLVGWDLAGYVGADTHRPPHRRHHRAAAAVAHRRARPRRHADVRRRRAVVSRRGAAPAPGPLSYNPGTGYVYANLGYCLLGCSSSRSPGGPYTASCRRWCSRPSGSATWRSGRRTARRPTDVCALDPRQRQRTWRCCGRQAPGSPRTTDLVSSSTRSTRPSPATTRSPPARRRRCASSRASSTSPIAGTGWA